jgi:ElaB/YqjD/DUF883 family membrane-anchored ribosome-binding protein
MTDIRTPTTLDDGDYRDSPSSESERVRSEIDDTREHLGQTVDAIGDRMLPGRIIERRKDTATRSLRGWRERLMGAADDTRHQISDSATSTVDQVKGAPETLSHKTEGSPLMVGGVAFAIGMLAAAIWRPTESERAMVERVTEKAPELTNDIGNMAREAAQSVKEEAAEAGDALKASVADATSATKAAATGD